MKKLALLLVGVLGTAFCTFAKSTTEPVDYVSPLVGTQSKHALSTGNTYPAIAMPWGMNFWVAQTGKMGDGWAYTYDADKIRGFKQTHQPSPWINDYGQFAIMPVTGKVVFDQDQRACKNANNRNNDNDFNKRNSILPQKFSFLHWHTPYPFFFQLS